MVQFKEEIIRERNVMHRKLALLLSISLVAVTTLACVDILGPRTLPVGESAPNFGIRVGDRIRTLNSYQGNVVMIVFWSST
jgi:hypothetical protein